MADPILSVVMPVYNRERCVEQAMESLRNSAVSAGARPGAIELIVVDDGSSDASARIASEAGARSDPPLDFTLLRQANAGPAAARNLGAERARAGIIAFFDSDDVWFPWTLRTILDTIEADPGAALLFLKTCNFTENAPPRPHCGDGSSCEAHDGFISAVLASREKQFGSFGTCNVVVRKDVFERLGGFDHEFRSLEDTDFFLRADTCGRCLVLHGDDLIGRRLGEADSLARHCTFVLDGLEKMKRREAAGLYPGGPGGDPRRRAFITDTTVRAARLCFADGQASVAYRLFFANLWPIVTGDRARRWLWRLPLTPVLSLIRPKQYPFRLRPRRDREVVESA